MLRFKQKENNLFRFMNGVLLDVFDAASPTRGSQVPSLRGLRSTASLPVALSWSSGIKHPQGSERTLEDSAARTGCIQYVYLERYNIYTYIYIYNVCIIHICIYIYMQIERDIQIDRQIDRQIDSQLDSQIDRLGLPAGPPACRRTRRPSGVDRGQH